MKKTVLCCAVALLSLSGWAQPKASAYHYQKASLFEILPVTSKDIVFLGNSITDGAEWSELFGNPRVKNRGISADKTWDVLSRLDPILKGQPKKVFLMIGTNDLAAGKTPEQVLANIRKIVERFRTESPKTVLYVQSVLPVNKTFADNAGRSDEKGVKIKTVNAGLEKMCGEMGLTYIDLWTPMADGEGRLDAKYTNDGLHLMAPGYLLWKEKIEQFVK